MKVNVDEFLAKVDRTAKIDATATAATYDLFDDESGDPMTVTKATKNPNPAPAPAPDPNPNPNPKPKPKPKPDPDPN